MLEQSSLTATLVGAGGLILGAVATSLASSYAARQKIREIEVTYEQKLKDNYLANARQYLNGVYVPIGIALGKLGDAYEKLRPAIDFKAGTADQVLVEEFKSSISLYLNTVDNLFEQGADSFLTSAMEVRLRSFNSFLRASLNASDVIVKFVFEFRSWRLPTSVSKIVKGKYAESFFNTQPNFSINLGVLGAGYRADSLLAAPATTRAFEKFIVENITFLKAFIKEVSLGTHVA